MSGLDESDAAFADERDRLFGLAYRLLGSVTEAEDVVQDAWLAWRRRDRSEVRDPPAFLTTLVSRRCLDVLRSARVRRETYVGPWLPEPLVTTGDDPVAGAVELEASVRMAFLVVLESLSPAERTAFVLREVFGHGYDDLARILDRSPEACRQLVARARGHVRARRPRFEPDPQVVGAAVRRFLDAALTGEVTDLVAVLHPDVDLVTDGGGRVSAARNVVVGSTRVARFFIGLRDRYAGAEAVLVVVNGAPGVILRLPDGDTSVFALDVEDDLVRRVHVVRNPDKLAHLARQ